MNKVQTMVFALMLCVTSQIGWAQSAMIEGEVTRVDPSAGKITLRHGPIKKLGMDVGMTMVFQARDADMLSAVKTGDKVKFDADRVNGQYVVTKIEKAR